MNIEYFTNNAQKVIHHSQEIAIKNSNSYLGCEHLHFALIDYDESLIKKLIIVIFIKHPKNLKLLDLLIVSKK